MSSNAIDLVYEKLSSTGPDGFEGLIVKLLENLTGYKFHLADSGRQLGRDMSSDFIDGSVIAIECKRYKESTTLNSRELLGEMDQACDYIPFLDLWVLVTTKFIPSQLHSELSNKALREGIVFEGISKNNEFPDISFLEVLYAQAEKIIFDFLESKLSQGEKEELSLRFEEIRQNKNYDSMLKNLKNKFDTAEIGYNHWKKLQNNWLINCFTSEDKSRKEYGQLLNVKEDSQTLIKRDLAWDKIDDWYYNWGSNKSFLAVLGEEGDGKSWTVASWIANKIEENNEFPSVVFLSSRNVNETSPREILANVINKRQNFNNLEFCLNKIDNWLNKSIDEKPLMLIVLDGINERYSLKHWRKLLEHLSDDSWKDKIALIITSRTAYWERVFSDLSYLNKREEIIPPYNDEELTAALSHFDLNINDISNDLLPMIRKPRYFDLMVKFRDRITKSGDVTAARLIYEDWKDRLERKDNLTELDNNSFRNIIKELALKYKKGKEKVLISEVEELLPGFIREKEILLDDLCTGGILRRQSGKYKVDENLLNLGFGLLLVEQAEEAYNENQNLNDVIGKWLEPYIGMDVKAKICEAAVLHSFMLDCPEDIKVSLLFAWVNSQNSGQKVQETFFAYFPLDKKSYTLLAEKIWRNEYNDPWVQDLIMDAFLSWDNLLKNSDFIISTFEKWLGYIHPEGFPFQRRGEREGEEIREEIESCIGLKLEPGVLDYYGYKIMVIENDGLLRLGRFALAVISHLPRSVFIHAIAIGCVAESIMGRSNKYKLFKWVVNSAQSSVWEGIKEEVKNLISIDNKITKKAAYRLLSFEGSRKAYKIKQNLPDDLFPEHPLKKKYEEDPCKFFGQLKHKDIEECLNREDLNLMSIAKKINPFCIDPSLTVPKKVKEKLPSLFESIDVSDIRINRFKTVEDSKLEDIEPIFYTSAPEKLVDFIHNIVLDLNNRKDVSLEQLTFFLLKHYLIFTEKEFKKFLTFGKNSIVIKILMRQKNMQSNIYLNLY
ncbi:hypothetical protein [Halanaerobacter jeridensis]|uniref:NACHT domain-containing protein n=1 Tax=Halanaerobacter jeridensis TaxID=706427 RepID=A0A938XUI3_9FIRM|nr:hypothetical protein [Halanaerobacter jeridensis]MBM7558149.1 hypothetical protein [Halanaerobacter jeridensis]